MGASDEYSERRRRKINTLIGLEVEIPLLDKEGKFLDQYTIGDLLFYGEIEAPPNVEYSVEDRYGKTPARLEMKLITPAKNVKEAVSAVKQVYTNIRRAGYKPAPSGKPRRGSMHVTLDLMLKCEDDRCSYTSPSDMSIKRQAELESLLIASTGTPGRARGTVYKGSLRVGVYPTIGPTDMGRVYIGLLGDNQYMDVDTPVIVDDESVYTDYRKDVRLRQKPSSHVMLSAERYISTGEKETLTNYIDHGIVTAIEYRFPERVEEDLLEDYLSAILLMHASTMASERYPFKIYSIGEGDKIEISPYLSRVKRKESIERVAREGMPNADSIAYERFSEIYDEMKRHYDLESLGIVKPRRKLFERNKRLRERLGIR